MKRRTVEFQVQGIDCAQCAAHMQQALAGLAGVQGVTVSLAAATASVTFDPSQLNEAALRRAIEAEGYRCDLAPQPTAPPLKTGRAALKLFGLSASALLAVALGEWLGLIEQLTARLPWPLWLAAITAGGWPIFRGVARAALRRRITAHTLMTVGLIAALAVSEWAAALLVVLFMRLGAYTERMTAAQSRRALRELASLSPQLARVLREGLEHNVPVHEVRVGELVVVRPGERVPVDGEVVWGEATVDQAAITGEAMPVEVAPGDTVFAASLVALGSLRLRATGVGEASTFGRVLKLVAAAEANRAEVQQLADRVAAYFLPVVAGIALLTLLTSRNPLAMAAVLLVACSCAFAMATPIAMLAAIGAAAKRGLLIKGGKYLELLAKADVLLLDKTGTVTLGKPQLVDLCPLGGVAADELLTLAAAAERDSEHPLAQAVRAAAQARGLKLPEVSRFSALPGRGVQAVIDGAHIAVGSRRLLPEGCTIPPAAAALEASGKTLLYVLKDSKLIGLLAAADTLRPEVPEAISRLRALGLKQIAILTGDNTRSAAAIAQALGIDYRAELLPEDKIAIVKAHQAAGRTVVMVGDGVNDAPALAQADVGIAMGAAGTAVAIEAAHVALMRDDWRLLPEVFAIARRTMRVVASNLAFTLGFNAIGLTLAALGLLPPVVAAAAQALPDLGILGNSARLLRPLAADRPPAPIAIPDS